MAIVKLFSAARTASVILGNAMYRFVFYDIVSPRKFCSFFLEAAICARSHLLGCFKLASLTSLIIHTIWISPRNHVFGTALGTRKSVQGGYRWIFHFSNRSVKPHDPHMLQWAFVNAKIWISGGRMFMVVHPKIRRLAIQITLDHKLVIGFSP